MEDFPSLKYNYNLLGVFTITEQEQINYSRIAEVIHYIKTNFKYQPTLNEMAEILNLSTFHFQRLFREWVGVSPKKYMQYISINHAKEMLQYKKTTLLDASYETGLSSSGRLHDLFINIEGMTPGEFKNGARSVMIKYSCTHCEEGCLLIASTKKGICHISFEENQQIALHTLRLSFPNAILEETTDNNQENALFVINHDYQKLNQVKLLLSSTPSQIKIWESILKMPVRNMINYCDIGKKLNNPKLSMAVSSSIIKEIVTLIPSIKTA